MSLESNATRIVGVAATHPRSTLAALALIFVASLAALLDFETGRPRLAMDPSTDSIIPRDSEGYRYHESIKEIFDGGDTTLVALVDDDVFTSTNLERIETMTERLEGLELVDYVSSLSTALNIRSEGGDLLIAPFMEEIPEAEDVEALADLRRRALADPIYSGNLVSRDGRISVLVVHLLDLPGQQLIDAGVDEAITRIAEEERGTAKIWISGGAHVTAAFSRTMLKDLATLVPLSEIVMGIVAFLSFGTFRGVAIPMATVAFSILVTLTPVGLHYGSLNQVTVAAPPILVVVGFAYSIHVLSAYYGKFRKAFVRAGGSRDGSSGSLGAELSSQKPLLVAAALREVTLPILLTGLTTSIGFFAMTTSPVSAVRQFGVFCATGTVVATLASLTLAPAILRLLPLPKSPPVESWTRGLDRMFERLAAFDLRHSRAIFAVSALVALAALSGIGFIEVRSDVMANFRPTSPTRVHFELVNEHLEGANAFQVILESDALDTFKNPSALRVLEETQQWLEAQPEVGGTTSLLDYVKTLNRSFHDAGEEAFAIPESRALVAQLLLVGGNDELDDYIDSDYQIANIAVRTTAIDSSSVTDLARRTEKRLEAVPGEFKTAITGSTILLSRASNDIARGQAISLAVAFVFIFAVLALQFMSPTAGLVALVPSALPVLFYFGTLGWTGVTLNTVTGLVACIVLGIAVDDTIHLMTHFNRSARLLADEGKGMIEALRVVGRPVTATTMALGAGFLCLYFSESQTQSQFGYLAAGTLAAAWLLDVTLTPALATRLPIVGLWEVLTVDLGEDPQRSIPLFAGLRTSEARTVALTASLLRYPKGHQLLHMGAEADGMYVVIEGELSASIPVEPQEGSGQDTSGRGALTLNRLQRGDVIGEVGLFHGRRSADVVAETDVRLLLFTRSNLERLTRRFPRIGARIHANLSDVLAQRLIQASGRIRPVG